jgi:hypothetical protein
MSMSPIDCLQSLMAWNGCSGKEQGILEDKEAAADKSLL